MSRLKDADALEVWLVKMLSEFDDDNDPRESKREMLHCVLSKVRRMPTVDAVPVEKVAYLLAEYFDSPCNFSPLDEEMYEVCGENCDMDDVQCWKRWIKLKLDGERKEDDGTR